MTWDEELIAWKTDAWKDPGMAAWYNQRMGMNQGINRLKNRVEVDLMTHYAAAGHRILDVGAGTGRASLPLAQAGRNVMAIDSSQAMLDQYRANAANLPIEFKVGDVTRLPCGDGEFDTVMSLNVMVHFPHWQEMLKEWRRATKAGGRIVFDIKSLDHAEAAARNKPQIQEALAQPGMENYRTQVKSDDVLAVADELGLAVIDMVPYAGVFGGGDPNYWLHGSLASKLFWERLLSWMALDKHLFDFGLFLEQECFARLSPVSASRMVVVLENREDKLGNAAWLERRKALDETLASGVSLPSLSALVPQWDAGWRSQLNAHLDWPRNRIMAYMLWSAYWDTPVGFDLASFLNKRHVATLERWREQWQMDALTTHLLRAMADEPNFQALFTYCDVPLGNAFEYDLTREVLTNYFEAFKA